MAKRVTIAQVKARAKELGIPAKWHRQWQEWEIDGAFATAHDEALSHVEYLNNNRHYLRRPIAA